MEKIKKVYNLKIIAIALSVIFSCVPVAYPYSFFKPDTLRVPSFFQNEADEKKTETASFVALYDNLYEEAVNHIKEEGIGIIEDPADYIELIKSRIARESKKGKALIVAVDGNSGAFKTTSAKQLAAEIRKSGGKAIVIERDWFIDSREERYKRQNRELEEAEVSLRDNEISLRLGKFEEEVLKPLQNFNNGNEQEMTLSLSELYDKYGGGGLTRFESFKIDRETTVIIEGNYLLTQEWKRYFDFKILMLARPSIGIKRRLPRDYHSDIERVEKIFWRINTASFISYLQKNIIKPDMLIITDSWDEERSASLQRIAPSASRRSL